MSESENGGQSWHVPAIWTILGVSFLLLITSFSGHGAGMFGWGFMSSFMWIWMILPILLVVLVLVLVQQNQEARK